MAWAPGTNQTLRPRVLVKPQLAYVSQDTKGLPTHQADTNKQTHTISVHMHEMSERY